MRVIEHGVLAVGTIKEGVHMDIGIDLDSVLSDVWSGTLPLINRDFGTSFQKYDLVTWMYVPENSKCGEWDFLERMEWAYRDGLIPPEEPLIAETVQSLRDAHHSVTIITRRTLGSHPDAARWVHEHEIPYDALVFTGRESKLTYPINILVDDHPGIIDHALRYPTKKIYLRDQPWNRDLNDEKFPLNVERASTLRDAAHRILTGKWA